MALGPAMVALVAGGGSMTPVWRGRWQTRLFLLLTVGVFVSLPFSWWRQANGGDPWTPFIVLGYVLGLGVAWDGLYSYLQSWRWNRDWPPVFQVGEGVVEGVVLGSGLQLVGLPGVGELTWYQFAGHYGLVWLLAFAGTQSLMRFVFPWWRYRGGVWYGGWGNKAPYVGPATEVPPLVPRIGRYEIVGELGERGGGMMIRARDPQLNREVAIKLLREATVVQKAQFRRENEQLATLRHPAVVDVYDLGVHEGAPYVVMPFMAGGVLRDRFVEGGVSLKEALPLLQRLADALDEAHGHGVVHGTLNADNVLFDEADQAYISGFGVGLPSITGLSLMQAVCLSPEQVIGGEATRPSDIYSLGVLAFMILTGEWPFMGPTTVATAQAHMSVPVPLITGYKESLPATLAEVFARVLAKEPIDRYPTARDFVQALRDIWAGRWYMQRVVERLPERLVPAEVVASEVVNEAEVVDEGHIGRYVVQGLIGEGGMGKVYQAYDPEVRRMVAIKVLPPQFVSSPQFHERFQHEAEVVANLRHEAIVPLYDYGQHGGQPYLVMRYLSGGTLRDKRGKRPWSLAKARPIVARIAAALDAAHEHGVVHLDVKPGNILFDDEGEAYLADFGTAWLTGAVGSEDEPIGGTPAYMSPQQAAYVLSGEAATPKPQDDIYALGVLLFEVLTGKLPFYATTVVDVLQLHVEGEIPSIRSYQRRVPAACQDIIEKALAKDVAERYQTGAELAAAVADLATGRWVLDRL
ncbi:MAG TPA: serine/threonine-protein kinase [Anaerolineae bacterium]|nr:serine/threonine-protein kinase [Anaerolineae bacterium]